MKNEYADFHNNDGLGPVIVSSQVEEPRSFEHPRGRGFDAAHSKGNQAGDCCPNESSGNDVAGVKKSSGHSCKAPRYCHAKQWQCSPPVGPPDGSGDRKGYGGRV